MPNPAKLINCLQVAEPSARDRQLCSYLRTSQHAMEHEGSLLHLQEPSTGPYPKQDQFIT
jgi:hypothetical protein